MTTGLTVKQWPCWSISQLIGVLSLAEPLRKLMSPRLHVIRPIATRVGLRSCQEVLPRVGRERNEQELVSLRHPGGMDEALLRHLL
jgi:hypothetical protein